LPEPKPLLTTYTIGADESAGDGRERSAFTAARAIKLKLTGEASDADRVRAVREARADVWLGSMRIVDSRGSFQFGNAGAR